MFIMLSNVLYKERLATINVSSAISNHSHLHLRQTEMIIFRVYLCTT